MRQKQKRRADWPSKIQWPPKWDPKSTKWRQKATCAHPAFTPFIGISETSLSPESIPIEMLMILCGFMIDLGLLFCNLIRVVDGFVIVFGTLSSQILANNFLTFTADKQCSDKNPPRSAKFKQDQPKRTPSIHRQTPHAKTNHENAEPQHWGGGGVTPHGVFNPLRGRRRPGRVRCSGCHSK